MSTATANPIKIAAFPAAAIEKCLTDELIETIRAEAAIKGYALPATTAGVVSMTVHVDSLVTVAILCAVEPIVGFELPESVVRTGGYTSVEAAVAHLLPRIQKLWAKKHGVKV